MIRLVLGIRSNAVEFDNGFARGSVSKGWIKFLYKVCVAHGSRGGLFGLQSLKFIGFECTGKPL